MKKLFALLVVVIVSRTSFADPSVGVEPPSAGWNFGNVTYGQQGGSLVLNSLSDNYGISQFNTFNTNGKAAQSLGTNDYIPENAVKNMLAIDGYTAAYDYNPQYTGLYASAYNQPLPVGVPLTELSFMGLAGNPNAIQNVYVPTSEYNTLSVQGVNGMLDPTTVLNQTVNGNTVAIAQETGRAEASEGILATGLTNETQARVAGDNALQGQIDATNGNVAALDNRVSNLERLKVMADMSVRILDTKKYTVGFFDMYDGTNRRNFALGARLTYKLGKSFEEELLEKQKKEIDNQASELLELRAMIHNLTKDITNKIHG